MGFVHDAQPWLTQPSRYLYSGVSVLSSGALAWAAASAFAALQARECTFVCACVCVCMCVCVDVCVDVCVCECVCVF